MWPKIIELIQTKGLTQKAIAQRVGVDQSTICRLSDGRAPEPRFSVGQALIELAGGADELRIEGIPIEALSSSVHPQSEGMQ